MSKPSEIEVVGLGLSIDTIGEYFANVVRPKMLWQPSGVVLHHTETPLADWKGIISLPELAHYYGFIKGWPSGPHCLIDPRRIWIFSPPWIPGTGSPSWNDTHFHVELVGDYAKEMMLENVFLGGVATCAAMYQIIGHGPTTKNFRFHKEDPRTLHKRCPGVNVGSKYSWIKAIKAAI